MPARSFVLLLATPLVAACASNPPPAPAYGATGPGAPTAPGLDLRQIAIEGYGWTIAVPPDTTQARDQYDQTVLASAAYTLTVSEWPQSDAFVQTLGEHLAGLREQDPGLTVLHQQDGGRFQFQAVVESAGHLDGTVLVAGESTGGMCSFELPLGADWRSPLAACQSLVVDVSLGEDEPYEGEDVGDGSDGD